MAFYTLVAPGIGRYNEFRGQRDLGKKCTMQADTLLQHILISYIPYA